MKTVGQVILIVVVILLLSTIGDWLPALIDILLAKGEDIVK